MTDFEMRALLEEIIKLQVQSVRFRTKDPADTPKTKLAEPATHEEMNDLSDFIGRRGLTLPPSYRQFLNTSNGIFRFRWQESFSLRSTNQLIEKAEKDEAWDDLGEDYANLEDVDEFGPVHKFIIGTGDVTVVCAFDPDTLDEHGEMKVIEFDVEANPPLIHQNFEAFLRSNLEIFKQDLELELHDRENLDED